MKKMIISLSALLMMSFTTPQKSATEENSFTLIVQNVKNSRATIHIGFYREGTAFPTQMKHSFAKEFIPNAEGEVKISWNDIAEGEYALAVYQDLNNSGKMEANMFGYPKEPFAFSNNIKPTFSAPKFKTCKISINKGSSHTIKLID